MRAVRFGSYSMCATLAGTPSLSRRKSIRRYARLCPPPWWRTVTLPWTLRPPRLCSGRTSDFSGSSRVTSTKSATLEPRRPGDVGLYLRIPIVSLRCEAQLFRASRCGQRSCRPVRASGARASEDLDRVARLEADQRALGGAALAVAGACALALALPVGGVHVQHADVEDLLDRDLDLGLVGSRTHQKGVGPVLDQPVALLRDDRCQDDVPRVGDHSPTPPGSLAASVSLDAPPASFSKELSACRSLLV